MFTVQTLIETEIERKGSRFLSFLCPYSKFQEVLEQIKKQHPKIVHAVWAYRYLNEFKQVVENQTDDGEPHKTAGLPTLNILRGNNMIDSAIITIRYFGGTLLGTGGLVKAYGDAAKEVIAKAEMLPHILKTQYNMFVPFADLQHFEYKCAHGNIAIIKKEFLENGATCTLEAPEDDLIKFLAKNE